MDVHYFCPSQYNKARKSNKRHKYWKEEVKLFLSADVMITYVENPKE